LGRGDEERVCRVIPPSALPGISPTSGEIGKWPGLPQTTGRHMNRKFRAKHGFLPISTLVGEMPGRAEGGNPTRAGTGQANYARLHATASQIPQSC